MNSNNLVSIIMLSHNSSQYVERSVNSILAQTYTNWELIFVDDNSKDDTIKKMMELKGRNVRFRISQTVTERGESVNRNGALKDARGRWIAFLDAGDIWEPNKLEKQIAFMKEHDYAFSYTMFNSIKSNGNFGITMSGPEHINEKDMLKCCWLGYLTVMYDREKVGLKQVRGLKEANDYALWLLVAEKAECHLLPECLASQMSTRGIYWRLITSNKLTWRYETYRKIEDVNPIKATYYTIRNLFYTGYKWWRYSKRK